jgi:hypothetical protein
VVGPRPTVINREYTLDDVNQGYADMHSGINIRGLIRYQPAVLADSDSRLHLW